ncbi:hypothetical protein DSM21852_23070 [Methylocystis bryophila]|nr:hypothetical protein DSM21852_23070 [Methylocystis bryophila]
MSQAITQKIARERSSGMNGPVSRDTALHPFRIDDIRSVEAARPRPGRRDLTRLATARRRRANFEIGDVAL